MPRAGASPSLPIHPPRRRSEPAKREKVGKKIHGDMEEILSLRPRMARQGRTSWAS